MKLTYRQHECMKAVRDQTYRATTGNTNSTMLALERRGLITPDYDSAEHARLRNTFRTHWILTDAGKEYFS